MIVNDGGGQGFLDHGVQTLAGMQQQQFGLRQAVDSGQLSIAPDAAANAAKACRDQMDRINESLQSAQRYAAQSGYGDCPEGQGLQSKMAKKWQEAFDLLLKEREILKNMAETYEAAGRAYQEAEDSNRHALGGQH